jgi:FlaA1/EpsC-like NDP-sugar epimerase
VVKGNGTEWQRHIFIWALPAVVLCRYIALWVCGLYRRHPGAAKRRTLTRIAAAVVLSELVAYFFVTRTQTLLEFPAKIFLVDAAICFVFLVAGRFAERVGLRLFRSWRRRGSTVTAS